MKKVYKVLLIDDHPIILEVYKMAIKKASLSIENAAFKIETAENSDIALQKIAIASKSDGFDIIFLDIKLPPSSDGEILSGEDIGVEINQLLPNAKIIISTTFNDNYRVQNILKNVNPDGFLIKNDIDTDELVEAIKTVIFDPPYYSKSVIKLLRKQISSDYLLDKIDRQLLHELSIGTKMKDLPDVLPMSIAGIERRKRQLKEMFNVEDCEDRELILKAKEMGFI
ncbi:MAG: response regulator [Lutibacter sp.]|nr:MAG: transcriptional regulator [Lutibacter sp. BRH_c52]